MEHNKSYSFNQGNINDNDYEKMKKNRRIMIVDDEPYNLLGL